MVAKQLMIRATDALNGFLMPHHSLKLGRVRNAVEMLQLVGGERAVANRRRRGTKSLLFDRRIPFIFRARPISQRTRGGIKVAGAKQHGISELDAKNTNLLLHRLN
jgi:hypothetical protein